MSPDAGLRPIEAGRAVIGWVDIKNVGLRPPKEDSAKNHDNWAVSLRDRTARILSRWLDQCETSSRYDGADQL